MRTPVLMCLAPTLHACGNPVTLTIGKYGTPLLTDHAPRPAFIPLTFAPAQRPAFAPLERVLEGDLFNDLVLPPASFSRH